MAIEAVEYSSLSNGDLMSVIILQCFLQMFVEVIIWLRHQVR
jgi:hypothetical protein